MNGKEAEWLKLEKVRLGVKNKVDLKREGKNWKSKAKKDKVSNERKKYDYVAK